MVVIPSFVTRDSTTFESSLRNLINHVRDLVVTGLIENRDELEYYVRDLENITGYTINLVVTDDPASYGTYYDFIASRAGVPYGRVRVQARPACTKVVLQTLQ